MDENDDLFDMWMLSNMNHDSGGCFTCIILFMIVPGLLITLMMHH